MLRPPVVKLRMPDKAAMLFKPAPYKVMHGGRGASKSWDMVQAALILGMNRKLFIVFGREIQRSIKESVHKLCSDRIEALGLLQRMTDQGVAGWYRVQDNEIVGLNGTRIVFMGVRNNILAIKSAEAIDIFIMVEANTLPKTHWDILLPTVRRDPPYGPFGLGSEFWIEFNPELASDDTYQMWVVNPPPEAVVVEVNWRDNPFFPEILRKQKDRMKEIDPDGYRTTWEGKTRKAVAGSIYSRELTAAILDNRVGPHIKLDPKRGVIFTFDLGRADTCAMWGWQQVGTLHNAVMYYENTGFDIHHFLQVIQDSKVLVSGIWLPPDAKQHHQSASKSIERQVRDVYRTEGIVRVIRPVKSVATRISYMRAIFPRVQINDQTCDKGVMALQHYQFGVHPVTKQRTLNPLHNWASHGADACGHYPQMLTEGSFDDEERPETPELDYGSMMRADRSQAWMG